MMGFKAWTGYPKRAILSDAFKTLSWCLSIRMSLSARFNVYLRSRTLWELAPTEAALYLHVKRSAFQLQDMDSGQNIVK